MKNREKDFNEIREEGAWEIGFFDNKTDGWDCMLNWCRDYLFKSLVIFILLHQYFYFNII